MKRNIHIHLAVLFLLACLSCRVPAGQTGTGNGASGAGQGRGQQVATALPAENEKITRQRAEALFAALSAADPWEKTPDGSTLAWGEAATLRTLVDLYEATANQKYLAEVARRGDRLLTHRDDRRGVADGSGKSRPAWSMASKYVVATGQLIDTAGKPLLALRSTPSAYNNFTTVTLIPAGAEKPGRFSLQVHNSHFKRTETFAEVSLDPADARFVEKIVNDPLAPYSTRAGTYADKSNLVHVQVATGAGQPVAQTVSLRPVPVAFMGYIGIIYDPMLRFAEIVKKDKKLTALVPAADRFIRAAEESYADASRRLWRQGPNPGEGYYLTCEKGESFPADNVGAPFNFQGRHVCAQLALYRLTGKKEYRQRAEGMLRHFKNRLQYDPAKGLYVWYYWFEPMTTTGWTPQDSLSANVKFFPPAPNMEDISHGVLDMAMVAAGHQAGLVFDDTDMRRFANTLLQQVVLPDRSGVRRRVDGQGEYPPYFRALHGWLVLTPANPEVYRAIRQAYALWDGEDLAFCANLLKWERRLEAKAGK